MAETIYTPFDSQPDAVPVRLSVRRAKPTPCSQLALFNNYSYHAFITDRDGDKLEAENPIRHLKYGVGLNHPVLIYEHHFRSAGDRTPSAINTPNITPKSVMSSVRHPS